jgi:hypothetical protein
MHLFNTAFLEAKTRMSVLSSLPSLRLNRTHEEARHESPSARREVFSTENQREWPSGAGYPCGKAGFHLANASSGVIKE